MVYVFVLAEACNKTVPKHEQCDLPRGREKMHKFDQDLHGGGFQVSAVQESPTLKPERQTAETPTPSLEDHGTTSAKTLHVILSHIA